MKIPIFVDRTVLLAVKGSYVIEDASADNCLHRCLEMGFSMCAVAPNTCCGLPKIPLPSSNKEKDGVSVYDVSEYYSKSDPVSGGERLSVWYIGVW